MPKPWVHALVSSGVAAATYAVTRRKDATAAAFVAGTLIDADHLVDFAVVKLTKQRRWIILPLHGWEYVPLLALFSRSPLMAAACVSYAIHLTLDQLFNGFGKNPGYFLLWRVKGGFDVENIGLEFVPHHWADKPISTWFR